MTLGPAARIAGLAFPVAGSGTASPLCLARAGGSVPSNEPAPTPPSSARPPTGRRLSEAVGWTGSPRSIVELGTIEERGRPRLERIRDRAWHDSATRRAARDPQVHGEPCWSSWAASAPTRTLDTART
jgi:hypothetical protein